MGTPFRDTDPETVEAVYASYGRMLLGAPPPEGSVTFHAVDAADLHAQMEAFFGAPDTWAAAEPGHGQPTGTPSRETGPDAVEAVYASYGRMVLGAPPPEGAATVLAETPEEHLALLDKLLGQPRDG